MGGTISEIGYVNSGTECEMTMFCTVRFSISEVRYVNNGTEREITMICTCERFHKCGRINIMLIMEKNVK